MKDILQKNLAKYFYILHFSGPSVEKKAQIYESILDFDDDDLLNLEDNDLELNTSQDHDELLREMDELLS